jgi:hypothetical protein
MSNWEARNLSGRVSHQLMCSPTSADGNSKHQPTAVILSPFQQDHFLRSIFKTQTMSTTANPPVEVEHDQYRLPTNVKATHYDVTIKTDLENLTFQGFVKIRYGGNILCMKCTRIHLFTSKVSISSLELLPSHSIPPTWILVLRELHINNDEVLFILNSSFSFSVL